jgi:hypothetical protein
MYRQRLEFLVNFANMHLMPKRDQLLTQKVLIDKQMGDVSRVRRQIETETQRESEGIIDRLMSAESWKLSECHRQLQDVHRDIGSVEALSQQITKPCGTPSEMYAFVERYEEMKRECEWAERKPIRRMMDIHWDDFAREMREIKAKADAFDELKKMASAKDNIIGSLLDENAKLMKERMEERLEMRSVLLQMQQEMLAWVSMTQRMKDEIDQSEKDLYEIFKK